MYCRIDLDLIYLFCCVFTNFYGPILRRIRIFEIGTRSAILLGPLLLVEFAFLIQIATRVAGLKGPTAGWPPWMNLGTNSVFKREMTLQALQEWCKWDCAPN